ncbi:MAG: uroporphyrinogen-III synthase [Rhodothermales bacterium]|nr:uroporphyrinogen-III synthase [Rhodothermales bacterium]
MTRPRIVLLRSPRGEPDPYVAAFDAVGFDAVCQPVLTFDREGEREVAERLARPGAYAGLVLTSPRAVEGLEPSEDRLAAWREKPAFVVGPATAEAAAALGLRPVGGGAGSAAALAAHIAEHPPRRPLLFLAGTGRRPDLPDGLRAAGVPFEEVTVYRTGTEPIVLAAPVPRWAAFFSPSGVRAARETPGFPWNRLRRAAIGPTTAAALREAGFPPAAVTPSPTPEALATAVAAAAPVA